MSSFALGDQYVAGRVSLVSAGSRWPGACGPGVGLGPERPGEAHGPRRRPGFLAEHGEARLRLARTMSYDYTALLRRALETSLRPAGWRVDSSTRWARPWLRRPAMSWSICQLQPHRGIIPRPQAMRYSFAAFSFSRCEGARERAAGGCVERRDRDRRRGSAPEGPLTSPEPRASRPADEPAATSASLRVPDPPPARRSHHRSNADQVGIAEPP